MEKLRQWSQSSVFKVQSRITKSVGRAQGSLNWSQGQPHRLPSSHLTTTCSATSCSRFTQERSYLSALILGSHCLEKPQTPRGYRREEHGQDLDFLKAADMSQLRHCGRDSYAGRHPVLYRLQVLSPNLHTS